MSSVSSDGAASKELDKPGQILAAVPQWWHGNDMSAKAVEQILAKVTLGDVRFEVLIGRRKYPNVNLVSPIAADWLYLSLLEHTQ